MDHGTDGRTSARAATEILTRRDFVTTATGYALAVSPVSAWAIQTPATGLEVADVLVSVGKQSMPAYLARPQRQGKRPVVLVIQEIFGLHEYIKDVCRRLAGHGYVAIAPSLYFRQGDATKVPDIDTLLRTIVNKVDQRQVWSDLDATVAWIGKQPGVDGDRLGITGFCWGGGVTWTYAAHHPSLKAGVAWYGRLVGDPKPDTRYPLDLAVSLTVPVLGLYGGKDKGIPLDSVEAMRATLGKGKSGSKLIVYPEAEHGFHADYRPSYHATSAKSGWDEMLAWFRSHGLAAS